MIWILIVDVIDDYILFIWKKRWTWPKFGRLYLGLENNSNINRDLIEHCKILQMKKKMDVAKIWKILKIRHLSWNLSWNEISILEDFIFAAGCMKLHSLELIDNLRLNKVVWNKKGEGKFRDLPHHDFLLLKTPHCLQSQNPTGFCFLYIYYK